MLGALADESVNGAQRSGKLFGIQLGFACFTAAYSMIVTVAILLTISPLRAPAPGFLKVCIAFHIILEVSH